MRQSKLFYKTSKQAPKEAEVISHKLLTRADFVSQLSSGIYSFLPLGWKVHQKIEKIIREEMERIGGQEIFLPALQPRNLWEETGRWKNMAPPLFKLKDAHQKDLALGSTHEEVITDLIRKRIKSWRDLPLYLFQIQTKFRNEMRATGGLLRTREFIMKDLYSFNSSEKEAEDFYQKVKKAYFKIFKRCGLKTISVEAVSGTIGGKFSNEFMVEAEIGENKCLLCKKCDFAANVEKVGEIKSCPVCGCKLGTKNYIEVGHIFYLGDDYSKKMSALFVDKDGKSKPILMGCYGIGLGRLMATIVEVNHDEKGIIWPKEVSPFQVHLIRIDNNGRGKRISEKIYQNLQKDEIEVLYDDRADKTPGEKFAEADLIGIPLRLVLSEKTLSKNSVEIKKRNEKVLRLVKIEKLDSFLKSY
jgi:prolyl-tRNA synthetase